MPKLPPRPVVVLAQAFLGWLERLRRALLPPELYLLESTLLGSVKANAVYTGTRLGLFDALGQGPRTSGELAVAIHADPTLTWRLLRALTSYGILDADGERYRLNAVSRHLLPGTGYREGIQLNAQPEQLRVWGYLPDSMRSPGSAFEHAHGSPFFDVLSRERQWGSLFDQAMRAWAEPTIAGVIQAWRPPTGATLVDVGGGRGHFLVSLLEASPSCRGILYDLPKVVAEADPTLAPVANRVTVASGSFFEQVPEGGDVYLLANVLHDWSDDDCVRILRRVRERLRPEARVMVVDIVVPPGNPHHPGPLMDITMMLLFRDGRERTEAEFRELARAAGLTVERVIPTATPAGIVVMRAG